MRAPEGRWLQLEHVDAWGREEDVRQTGAVRTCHDARVLRHSNLLPHSHGRKDSVEKHNSRLPARNLRIESVHNLVFVVEATHNLAIVTRVGKIMHAAHEKHAGLALQREETQKDGDERKGQKQMCGLSV